MKIPTTIMITITIITIIEIFRVPDVLWRPLPGEVCKTPAGACFLSA